MRMEYRKAVRQRFREAMAARLPEFELVKIRAPILFTGETVFRRVAGPDLHTFILLVGKPVSRAMDILLESGVPFLDAWVAVASGESGDGAET